MNVALWAEIRRLSEIEKLSGSGHRSTHALLATHCRRRPQPGATTHIDANPTAKPARSVRRADQGTVGQTSRPLSRTHP